MAAKILGKFQKNTFLDKFFLKTQEGEIGTWGFWCSLRALLHHTSSARNSHSAPEPLSLSNCIKLWGILVLVQYDANIWC